jgi:hypothetical protein
LLILVVIWWIDKIPNFHEFNEKIIIRTDREERLRTDDTPAHYIRLTIETSFLLLGRAWEIELEYFPIRIQRKTIFSVEFLSGQCEKKFSQQSILNNSLGPIIFQKNSQHKARVYHISTLRPANGARFQRYRDILLVRRIKLAHYQLHDLHNPIIVNIVYSLEGRLEPFHLRTLENKISAVQIEKNLVPRTFLIEELAKSYDFPHLVKLRVMHIDIEVKSRLRCSGCVAAPLDIDLADGRYLSGHRIDLETPQPAVNEIGESGIEAIIIEEHILIVFGVHNSSDGPQKEESDFRAHAQFRVRLDNDIILRFNK